MSYKVRLNEQAKKDLKSIYSYIAFELREPLTAAGLYWRIKTEISKLSEMPERHPLYPGEPWHSRGLRRLVVENYLAFYWLDSRKNTVIVLRIMYGRRNIAEQLRKTVSD